METQKIPKSQSNLGKEEWSWRNQLPSKTTKLQNYKTVVLYYKTTVINMVWHWHKSRNIDQWNKTESPEINLCTYEHLNFDKESNNIQ